MDFQKLKHLLAVVEYGTFSLAAKKVNLSQPALSRSIQALEAELGLPLLDRGTRQVRLTPYGACVAERARRMRFEEAELQRELKTLHSGESGTLTIGLSPTPSALLLSPFLAHMAANRPQVRVGVELGATAVLLDMLRAERIDAMVCDARMLYEAADIETRPLAPLRAGMVCRRDHPILAHRHVSIHEVRQYPVASSTLSPEVSLRLAETLGPGGAPDQMVTLRCENLDPLVDLALHTDTLLLGVICVTRREQEEGRLIEVPLPPDPQRQGHYVLARLAGRTPLTAQDALYDFTQQCWAGFAAFNPRGRVR
ncbi:LysR family transcriptional regulator [Achromobacter piechaudii]|uniref:Transcriptional regulator, LysR family n=1 Tax=Achromobacter piechaudii ATCC 43553 TaxID=742159 RepID=D4XBJ0_9BURK|nr:LysR family transcriptional regulator [Achromobacter piechaudii]EFF75776.1 transcriptional regulator, LysR family [Achromobacter piechaudii ATCC 43553]